MEQSAGQKLRRFPIQAQKGRIDEKDFASYPGHTGKICTGFFFCRHVFDFYPAGFF
jgi:hypothetical protein